MRNDDYLWAKIGSDPEVEQLENALSVFRHREMAERTSVANVVAFPVRARRKRFALAYAAAASLLLAALAGSLWLRTSRTDDVKLNATRGAKKPVTAPVPSPDLVAPKKEDRSGPPPARVSAKRTHIMSVRIGVPTAIRSRTRTKADSESPKPELTKEEKYAYERLMLALSITSSNLRLVADKIDIQDASADGGR